MIRRIALGQRAPAKRGLLTTRDLLSRRRLALLAGIAFAGAVAGVAWAMIGSGSGSASGSGTASARATATIQRRNLVQRETVSGTLGYADATTLVASTPGTVTALREPGKRATRGQALYWVNGEPVTLMYGQVPMWRRLDAAAGDGKDIRQLERNLVALGYDPDGEIEIDSEWDSATTAAVKRWQDARGRPETGRVDLGQIAFLPGPQRIGELKTKPGAMLQPGAEVVEVTSTRRIVTVDLDADKQAVVSEGDAVLVTLPDGRTVAGKITSVSSVAEAQIDPQTGEQGSPTVPVEIELARGAKTGSLDEAPVDVSLEKERVKNVLVVPVTALLALAEGGYAVEVVASDGSTHLVAVTPGTFADGFVQVSGKGIKKGIEVVVPA